MSTPGQHPLVKNLRGAVSALTVAPGFPELVRFAGFASGSVQQPGATNNWLLMYLDGQLRSWLLIEVDGIVHSEQIKDDSAPSGKRDMIWVKSDAAVGMGAGPQSDAARFLTGEFTRAGDFDASPAGGTRAASTGAFCGANTPLCCTRRSP
jgi:hypothetical protein